MQKQRKFINIITSHIILVTCHCDTHIAHGAFTNLVHLLADGASDDFFSELPLPALSYRLSTKPQVGLKWNLGLNEFLQVFRKYGFASTKRGMSARNKMVEKKQVLPNDIVIPFPSRNLEFLLMFMTLYFRSGQSEMGGHDLFSLVMFFLRMIFEDSLPHTIAHLAASCLEELIEAFPVQEWRREWAKTICDRIASVKGKIHFFFFEFIK